MFENILLAVDGSEHARMQDAINARLNKTKQIIQKAVQILGTLSAEIHPESIEGDPAEVILVVAKIRNINVIVMGSRGLGKLAGLLLGAPVKKWLFKLPARYSL
jgi:nucleotide-binding universal stress UspA family protein